MMRFTWLQRRALAAAMALMALMSLPALPAAAQSAPDLAGAEACFEARLAAGQPPAACLEAAHADCALAPQDAPAVASLCYREAQAVWDGGIGAEMARIREKASEEISAIAAIEVKYDLLAALTQCARMEELARAASSQSGEEILRAKSRCTAAASGLAYLRLKLRGRGIE